jgi:hypothetical protein
MVETTARRWPPIVIVISVLMAGEAITFLLATLLHAGIPIPLGFSEPPLAAAAIVEGLCWFFLSVSLYAVFAHKTWAWMGSITAHLFAIAGVVLGIFATSRSGAGGEANFIYHRVILVILVVVLGLLVTPGARSGLGRGKQAL